MSSLSPGPIRHLINRHCRLFSKNEAARVNAWNAQSPVNTGPKNQKFSKDWNDAYLRKIVMHEYGHALGLPHSENRNSIMYWLVFAPSAERLYGNQTITAADLNAATISKASKDHQKDAQTAGH